MKFHATIALLLLAFIYGQWSRERIEAGRCAMELQQVMALCSTRERIAAMEAENRFLIMRMLSSQDDEPSDPKPKLTL